MMMQSHPPKESVKSKKEQLGRESSTISIASIRHICTKCPARKSKADLKILHDYVSNHTEMGTTEPLWKFLPWSLQMELCRHIRYIHHDADTLEDLKVSSSSSTSSWNYPYPKTSVESTKLIILMQGDAELACGEETRNISLRNGNGVGGHRGRGYNTRNPSFGSIQVPNSIIQLICQMTSKNIVKSGSDDDDDVPCWVPTSESYAFIHWVRDGSCSNVQASDGPLRASILFHRGCHCLSINNSDLRFFMERLFDQLLSQRVLYHLRLDADQMRKRALVTFPVGSPIMLEGVYSNKIVLILRGSVKFWKRMNKVDLIGNGNKSSSEDENILEMELKILASQEDSDCMVPGLHDNDQIEVAIGAPMTFVGHLPHFLPSKQTLLQDSKPTDKEESQTKSTVESSRLQPLSVVAFTPVRALVLDAQEFLSCLKKQEDDNIELPNQRSEILKAFETTAWRQWKWIKSILPRKMLKVQWDATEKDEDITPFPTASMIKLEELVQEFLNSQKKPRLNKKKILSEFKRLMDKDDQILKEDEVFHTTEFSELQKAIELDWDGREHGHEHSHDELRPHPTMVHNREKFGKTLPHLLTSDGFFDPFSLSNKR